MERGPPGRRTFHNLIISSCNLQINAIAQGKYWKPSLVVSLLLWMWTGVFGHSEDQTQNPVSNLGTIHLFY